MPRRAKGVYSFLIFFLVVAGAALQWNWMKSARRDEAQVVVSDGFAAKISRWMLARRGIYPDDATHWDESGVERIVCESCGGTGRSLLEAGTIGPCPICQGVGYRMIRRFGPDEHLCPFCVGMGRAVMPDTGEITTCPRCNGRGLVAAEGPAAEPVPVP
ncbi:MAG: hypothetical protein PHO14_09485 [Kiritimatiellae bacterium]|jgi:hypothetical protein|nr:hypothetical protein [Kiritimatiellia bacterium]